VTNDSSVDRMDLSRLPSSTERWTGIVLSTVLLVSFALLSIFAVKAFLSSDAPLWFPIVSSVATLLIGTILYRMVFTSPRPLGPRAIKAVCYLAILSGISIMIMALALPRQPQTFYMLGIGCTGISVGIGNLIRVRQNYGKSAA